MGRGLGPPALSLLEENMANQNRPWFASGHSTAAGLIVEWNPMSGYVSSLSSQTPHYGSLPTFRLRGFAISGSTAVAISTVPIKLNYGRSSGATLTTIFLCAEPGAGMLGAANIMGIEAGYFSIRSTVAHADGGLTGLLWGD